MALGNHSHGKSRCANAACQSGDPHGVARPTPLGHLTEDKTSQTRHPCDHGPRLPVWSTYRKIKQALERSWQCQLFLNNAGQINVRDSKVPNQANSRQKLWLRLSKMIGKSWTGHSSMLPVAKGIQQSASLFRQSCDSSSVTQNVEPLKIFPPVLGALYRIVIKESPAVSTRFLSCLSSREWKWLHVILLRW